MIKNHKFKNKVKLIMKKKKLRIMINKSNNLK